MLLENWTMIQKEIQKRGTRTRARYEIEEA